MKICPKCSSRKIKTADSRVRESGLVTRRKKRCIACGYIFKTIEKIEDEETKYSVSFAPLYAKSSSFYVVRNSVLPVDIPNEGYKDLYCVALVEVDEDSDEKSKKNIKPFTRQEAEYLSYILQHGNNVLAHLYFSKGAILDLDNLRTRYAPHVEKVNKQ